MDKSERELLIRGGFGFLSALFGVIFKKKAGRKTKVINIMNGVFELADTYETMIPIRARIGQGAKNAKGINLTADEVQEVERLFQLVNNLGV